MFARPRPLSAIVFAAVAFVGCNKPEPAATSEPETPPYGLSADRLSPETTTSDMFIVVEDKRMPLGTARREMARTTLDGKDAIRFVLVQDLRQGSMYDTLWVDAATLLPMKYKNDFGELQTIRMTYGDDGHVVSNIVRGGQTTGVDTMLTGPHFDLAEFSMVLPALPLAEGYSAEIPVFHYERGAMTNYIDVVGAQQVEYGGSMRDAWAVRDSSANASSTHYVDKENGMTLRVEAAVAPGRMFEQVARGE